MVGGVLEIVGTLALLCCACRLLLRWLDRRAGREAIDLSGYPPAGDQACAWPTLEPEVARMREKGAL